MTTRNNNFATYGNNALDLRYSDESRNALIIQFPGKKVQRSVDRQQRMPLSQSPVARLAAKSAMLGGLLYGGLAGVDTGSFSRSEIAAAFGVGIAFGVLVLFLSLR